MNWQFARPESLLMGHEVLIVDTGDRFSCTDRESVLSGMTRLGRKGIPAGCRGGGCGVCKVRVIQGQYQARQMSRQHVSAEEQLDGVALACCIVAESDLRLTVVGKIRKAVVRVRERETTFPTVTGARTTG
ncbi:2Fe-2S iron-sulfur cluster-binding protein [Pseudomonas sp. BN606]|uniref:2Fe-2S iron-sulfur cluster-binding protein n=2 Tax=Pseudomonas TaxID=286 RepID=UPI0032AF65AB